MKNRYLTLILAGLATTLLVACGKDKCAIEGCDNEIYKNGLCPDHYIEVSSNGSLDELGATDNGENANGASGADNATSVSKDADATGTSDSSNGKDTALINPTKSEPADIYDESVKLIDAYAKEHDLKVNDVTSVIDKGESLVYASLGPSSPDVAREEYDGITYTDGFIDVVYVDSALEVRDLGKIILADSSTTTYSEDDLWFEKCGVFDFGESKHYYVGLYGIGFGQQYKYGIVDGTVSLIDAGRDFMANDNGVYCHTLRQWGKNYNSAEEYVEVGFLNDMYIQYSSREIPTKDMSSKFSNYSEVVSDCTTEILELTGVPVNQYEAEPGTMSDAKLDYVRLDTNGKYYLTFSFKVTPTYGGDPFDMHVYYTFSADNDKLLRERNVNYIDKLETSNSDLPAK